MPPLSPGAMARSPHPGVGWVQKGPCSSLCPPPPSATPRALLLSSSAIFFPDRKEIDQFYGLQIHPNQSLHSPSVPLFPARPAASQATSMSQPAFLPPLAPASLLLPPGCHLPWCLSFSLQSRPPLFWFPQSGWKNRHSSQQQSFRIAAENH